MKLRRKKKRVVPSPIPDVQMSPTLDGSRFPPSIFNSQEHLKTRLRVRDIIAYEKIIGRPARDTSTYGTIRRRISKVHRDIFMLNIQKKQVANKVVKDGIIYDIELKVEELLKLNRLRDRVQKHIVTVGEGY